MNPVPHKIPRFLFALFPLLGLAACGRPSPSAASRGPAYRLAVAPVVVASVVRWRSVPGTVSRTRSDVVRSLDGGTVTLRPYRVGSRVPGHALLLVVGGSGARADLARARAAWIAARARARLASRNEARYRALVRQGAVTRLEYEEVHRRFLAARAAERAARLGLAAARRIEAHAIVRAPFAGLIAALPVRLGEDVLPGTMLLHLVGGAAEVRTAVGDRLYPHVRVGESVRVHVTGRVVRGRVLAVDPALDPETRTHAVTILLLRARPDDGAYARVSFPVSRARAVLVPRAALVRRAGVSGVFVVGAHGRVAFVLVRVGREGPHGTRVVLSGLVPGERVVLDAPPNLESGDTVTAGTVES
jgi:multidrug efflux system membrane fusion protein